MSDPRVWARGKTYEEVLGIGDQMVGALQQVALQQQQYQPPAPVPSGLDNLRDDDIVDVKTMRAFAQSVQAQVPRQDNARQLAEMAVNQVQNESKFAPIFQDYGPEVWRELGQLPHGMWTLDNIRMVANLVLARHVDEVADKRARIKMENMGGLPLRGNGPGTTTVESDGLPTNWQEILRKKDLSLSQVESFCVSNNYTVKKWFEHFGQDASTMGAR